MSSLEFWMFPVLGGQRLDPVSGEWGLHPDEEHSDPADENVALLPQSGPSGGCHREESGQSQAGRERLQARLVKSLHGVSFCSRI